MDDLISRQAAVEALLDLIDEKQEQPSYSREQIEAFDAAWRAICDLPSAEQPKIGKWTSENACSECGCQPWFERNIWSLHYCPNCGAKMEEEDEVN